MRQEAESMRNPIPRVVTIHDISGIGRTSLTAAIPVLSSMGIQPVPLPTAVLSTQTVGTTGFTFLDLTQNMKDMLDHWIARGDRFEGVYSGFMACPDQMDTVARCIETCMLKGGLAVVDPVLGEDGQLIPTMTADMVRRMRWLIGRADVITPNYTEVCLLLDVPYDREPDMDLLKGYLRELSLMGPGVAVGTSMPLTKNPLGEWEYSSILAYEKSIDKFWRLDCSYLPAHYPGTGDIFASVLTGSLLLGSSLSLAIDKAEQFDTLCVRDTYGQDRDTTEGVLLERYLPSLRMPLPGCRCVLVN